MVMRFGWMAVFVAGLLAAGISAAGAQATFGAVTVTCAADRACVAVVRSQGEDPGSVLQIARGPGSRDRWTIAISTLGALADRKRAVSLSVDNGVGVTLSPGSDFTPLVNPSDFYIISQNALDRLMVRLQAGHHLRFSWMDIAGAPHTDRFSLNGLGDALSSIDQQQNRVAGDRRAGPPVGLPPAPDVDGPSLVAEAGVPPRLLEWHLASSECEAPTSPALSTVAPVIGPLSETAILYALPCFQSEGRTSYRLYLNEMGEIGGMHLLTFAVFSSRFGWMGTDVLEDVAFDRDAKRLTAEDKSPNGCNRGSWVWDAYAFRMESFEVADSCAGTSGAWRRAFPAT